MKLISWILVVFTVLFTVQCQISELPLDVTAKVGGNLTLRCGVIDPQLYTEWMEFITISTGNVIYDTINGVFDPNKYEVEGTYHLTIKNLQFTDGGYYGCKVAGMRSPERADVVVIDDPEPYSEDLYEGDVALMMCTSKYESASHDEISPDHIPKVEGYIYEDTKVTDAELVDYVDYFQSRIMMNYTANVGDNGRDLTCKIYTTEPYFEAMSTMTLNVLYSVHNLAFAPRNEYYYVGEYVNCTADGNPAATYEWIPVSSPGAAPVYQSTLNIISTMIGPNTWRCVARNEAKEPIAIDEEISFEVYPNDDGNSGESGGPETAEAWVIAVAVIVPLVVIAVIVVLIFVFWKKRMAPPEKKPKSPASNPNFESSSIEEDYPDPNVNGKPAPQIPPTAMARPLPQRVNNAGYSTHPNPHMGNTPPSQPQGKSPGYADLGIKHIPAYAQPPSLNSSLDHNMGSQPNIRANLNPNPYSRAPIVMAAPGNQNVGNMNQKRQASLSGSLASLGSETGV